VKEVKDVEVLVEFEVEVVEHKSSGARSLSEIRILRRRINNLQA